MNSFHNPDAHWLGSPNFTPDRAGHDMTQPSWVVLHTMVGTVASANARFQQSSEQASATYGVGLDGQLYQWVDEKDAAWANGATGRGGKGDNLDSISIEHEDGGDYNGPRTPELYAASAALVHDICTRYGIPIDRQHVIGHRECDFSSTACPDALDIDRIVAAAAAGGNYTVAVDNAILNGTGSGPTPSGEPWMVWALKDIRSVMDVNATAAKTELDTIKTELGKLAVAGVPPANLQPLIDAVERLAAHLGQGTP